MGKIKILGIVFFCLGVSCSKILDKGPLDQYSETEIWGDVNLADGFITSTYPVIRYLMGEDDWSDNMIQNGNNWFMKEQFDSYTDFGWDVYSDVRKCNMIIEKVGASKFTEIDKTRMIAEAKMLRAIIYFKQARLFGRVMIVDKVLNPDDELKYPRTTTIKETYDFILKDLDDAYIGLPTTAGLGRLTKGAALALMAQVALHGAAYIESGKDVYYQKVITSCELLFALNYQLDPDYKKLFNDFTNATTSKEIILAIWSSADNNTCNNTPMQTRFPNCGNVSMLPDAPKFNEDFMGWANKFPTQSLVDNYLVIDNDGVAKKYNETSYYNNFVANGGSVYNAIYKNRDKRFYASVVNDSSYYFHSWIYIRDNPGGNLGWNSNKYEPGVWCNTKSGYYFRKRVYENVAPAYDFKTPYHNIALRLGKSYLDYAEVMLRTNQTAKAIEFVNKTRTIHGGLPALSTGLSQVEAWKWYRIERRVELFDEYDRYWSLLRWGKADGLTTIPELIESPLAIDIAADGKSFSLIPLPYNLDQNIDKVFTVKRYLLPVPTSQLLLNEKLDQNPGW